MVCRLVKLPDGHVAIVCGPRSRRRANCFYCTREYTRLCDFPRAWKNGRPNQTCDRKLCHEHSTHIGHQKQGELYG